MKTLEQVKSKAKASRGLNTVEDSLATWYKPPTLKSVLTEELAHQIAECYLDGCTDEETASLCDVAVNTLKNWKDFDCIKKFERQRKSFYVHEIRDGKRRDWTRLAWWLERRYPLEFSRPEVAHAISTSIHTTVNTTQNLIVSSELAEQLAERNARVSTKIEELFANRSSNRQVEVSSIGETTLGQSVSPSLQHVKEIVASTTLNEDVAVSPNDDMSSPNNPPLLDPGVVTPTSAAGQNTDSLSRTGGQKTKYLGRKAVKALLQIPEDIKKYGDSASEITRKKFDTSLKKTLKPLELEGQVIKTKIQSIVTPEDRPAMEGEIQRRSRETKLDRTALRMANKKADKLHPRKAHT